MIPAAVRYARATDLDHALALLAAPDAKALAGGQSLIPVMKLRVVRPALVVDISRLELRGAEIRDDVLHIAPLTTWRELLDASALERQGLAAIAECVRGIGDAQVRNRGTIGGSIAHADPASDMPAVLLALGASVVARSPEESRTLALADFFLGPFTTGLGPHELLVDLTVPLPEAGSGSAYVSVEHPASGFALAGAAALSGPAGERVALTGVGATPFLLPAGEPSEAIAAVEVYGDSFAPAEYRRHLAAVVAERALEAARRRAKEDV